MSVVTKVQSEKFVAKQTWQITNEKEWKDAITDEQFSMKTDDFVFDNFPNIKWKANLYRVDNKLALKLTIDYEKLELQEKGISYDYQVIILVCRGTTKAFWQFWESEQTKLCNTNEFEKDFGTIASIQKFLDTSFDIRITVILIRHKTTTIIKENLETTPKLNVIANLKKMLESGDHSDVTLVLGEKKYKLHKNILSARSKYFAEYFKENPDATTVTLADNVSPKLFDILVNFIYTADAEMLDNDADIIQMFGLGHQYDVSDLKEIYECMLETRVNHENALHLFCCALKYDSCHGLKKRAFDVIQRSYKEDGIHIPSKLIDRSALEIQEFIRSEIRFIENQMKSLDINEE